jgi:hypothetical protein
VSVCVCVCVCVWVCVCVCVCVCNYIRDKIHALARNVFSLHTYLCSSGIV